MNHDRARDLLARRRELTHAERNTLEEHLAGCAVCRDIAAAYSDQTASLRAIPESLTPPVLRARVLAATREARPISRSWGRFLPALSAASAAAVLAVVLVFAWAHRPQGGTPGAGAGTPAITVTPGHATSPAKTPPATVRPGAPRRTTEHHETHHGNLTHAHGAAPPQSPRNPSEAPQGTNPSTRLVAALPPAPATAPGVTALQRASIHEQPAPTSRPPVTSLVATTRHPAAQPAHPPALAGGNGPVAAGGPTGAVTPAPGPTPPRTAGGAAPTAPRPPTPKPSPTIPPVTPAAPPTATSGSPSLVFSATRYGTPAPTAPGSPPTPTPLP